MDKNIETANELNNYLNEFYRFRNLRISIYV